MPWPNLHPTLLNVRVSQDSIVTLMDIWPPADWATKCLVSFDSRWREFPIDTIWSDCHYDRQITHEYDLSNSRNAATLPGFFSLILFTNLCVEHSLRKVFAMRIPHTSLWFLLRNPLKDRVCFSSLSLLFPSLSTHFLILIERMWMAPWLTQNW